MKNLILPVLILLTAISGCDIYDFDNTRVITGSGDIVSLEMDVEDFTSINNTGVANVYITRGDTQSVTFNAQQNILDLMTGRVRRDQLVIGFADNISIRNSREIFIEITTPGITAISSQGVGDFFLEGDSQSELYINITGVGNVWAYDQPVDYCRVVLTGVGNCYVLVHDTLDVVITGVGRLHYWGDPNLITSITGVGGVINDN